jgi:hypothetical protein
MNQKWYHSLKAFLIVFSGFFLLGPAWSQDSHFEVNSMNEAHRKQSDTLAVDILISGGTLSAPAAALQAARSNPEAKILLIEPTAWLGGQATSQGVSAIDNTWFNPGATLMRENPEDYYPADYLGWLEQQKNPPAEAPGEGMAPNGTGWVSRECFDPRTAAWLLDRLMEGHPNIQVMKLTVVKAAGVEDVTDEFGPARKITGATLLERTPKAGYQPFDDFLSEEILDWYDPDESSRFTKKLWSVAPRSATRGLTVIDASELGDLIVLSGARYTVGREMTTEYLGEDGSLPEMDEDGTQAFVYPFCVTGAESADPEEELKTDFSDFDNYLQEQTDTYFSLGSHSWESVWTYRRLKRGSPDGSAAIHRDDVSMQNWYPGNDYPYGSFLKNKADASVEAASDWKGAVVVNHLAEAEKHALAYYFYYKANKTVSWHPRYLRAEHPMNMMGTATGLSMFPYVRGTRRIIGLSNFRLTERYYFETDSSEYDGGASFQFFDSVGIGNYAADIHPSKTSTGLSPTVHKPAPFYVPYRALGSANVRNLLVGGKLLATTYITNSAYRLHPIEWVEGSAIGAAAARMAENGWSNMDLLDTDRLRDLQQEVNANSPISWKAYDPQPIPARNGDMIVNSFRPISGRKPFIVEIYHHRGVRAEVFQGGEFLGETTTKTNGRLVLEVASVVNESDDFLAVVYDAGGAELDQLTTQVGVALNVVDNEDAGFTATGEWAVGTVQPNKFGASYHYSWGGAGEDVAEWQLLISTSGRYEVSIWYPEAFNRATDAPFTIHHQGGQTTILVNQQENGGQWFSLGEFDFDGAEGGKVVLTNDIGDTEQLVVADAVKSVLKEEASPVGGWQMY